MAVLMGAFREIVVKRLAKDIPGGVTLLSPHRGLCATTHGKAYVVGQTIPDSAALVIVQGPSGTTAPVTADDVATVVTHAGCAGSIHLYAESFDAASEATSQIVPHALVIDPFKFIPDMYRKAKTDRHLLAALQLLGKMVA
ncbi:MAG: hypothetical protein ACYCSN_19495 [Acidobacteriaceae bacterium]